MLRAYGLAALERALDGITGTTAFTFAAANRRLCAHHARVHRLPGLAASVDQDVDRDGPGDIDVSVLEQLSGKTIVPA